MANHQSAKKRIRQDEKKRVHNKYYHKTARNAVRALRDTTTKTEAEGMLSRVCSLLDRLAKRNIIHKKKAANIKSSISVHVNSL